MLKEKAFKDFIQEYERLLNFNFVLDEEILVLKKCNAEFYTTFLPANYSTSYVNPDFCVAQFEEIGIYLSNLMYQILQFKEMEYNHREFTTTYKNHLSSFIELLSDCEPSIKQVHDRIIDFSYALENEMLDFRITKLYCQSYNRLTDIIVNNDLLTIDYLFKLPMYVSEDIIRMSEYIAKLPE